MKFVEKYRAWFWVLAAALLAFDLLYSSFIFSSVPLDGDLGRISGPILWYEDVLNDPFGFRAIKDNVKYGGAGRYFCHFSCKWWFDDFHAILRNYIQNPIHRFFFNSSSFVFVLQILFVILAYLYAKGRDAFSLKTFFPLALFSSVFIQFGHFQACMGIFDLSISYTFFYALPILVLAIYFLPFYKWHQAEGEYSIPKLWHLVLPFLAIFLSFSGALIQPILFIVVLLYLFGKIFQLPIFRLKLNAALILQLGLFLLLSLYAYFVTKYNAEADFSVPLMERYILLFKGIGRVLTLSLAWPIIILAIGLSAFLIRKYELIPLKKMYIIGVFVFSFILVYLFLLPLGGYRSYRPLIVRYDTFLPVTLGLLFLLFYMTYTLYTKLETKAWKFYSILYFAIVATFFLSDRKAPMETNSCQRVLMQKMLSDSSAVVKIPFQCNMLTWSEADAKNQTQMTMVNKCMRRWGFLQEEQRLEFTFEK